MRAGSLDRMIELQQRVEGTDAAGQPLDKWRKWRRTHAAVRRAMGRSTENFEEDQFIAKELLEFEIRFVRGVESRMRIIYEGRVYDIHTVTEIQRRKGWKIVAEGRSEDREAEVA